MVMYFVATLRQPFADCAHDQNLALSICNGIRPEITEKYAPKCYINLMKRCWDPNPDNRPNAEKILELIRLFKKSEDEIAEQFKEVHSPAKNIRAVPKNDI